MLQPQRAITNLLHHRLLPTKSSNLWASPFSTYFPSLLSLCKKPCHLLQIHARFLLQGFHQSPTLASQLIESYVNFGLPDSSKKVFYSFQGQSSHLYNGFLRNLAKLVDFEGTLLTYREMALETVYPDEETYLLVFVACSSLLDVRMGRRVHGDVAKLGLDGFWIVANGLLEMYREFGDEMDWDSLTVEASRVGNVGESFDLYVRMRRENVAPDSCAVVGLLRSCTDLGSLKMGRAVHCVVLVNGLSTVDKALLSMYSKLGSLQDMRLVFKKMPEKDSVARNTLLSAYSRHGFPEKAMELVRDMVVSGIGADLFTAIPALSSIGKLKSINLGREMHGHVIRNELDYHVSVCNALIEMYCECSCLNHAQKTFNLISNKTIVSWSSMMKGYVNHDRPLDALYLFKEMRSEGPKVDGVMVLNLLPACVKIGALELIKNFHGLSMKLGLNLLLSVSTALLVSYAKCGCIEMARKVFDEEEIDKDVVAWTSMIGAYAKHGDWFQGFEVYSQLKQSGLKPSEITFLGLLTACANSGLVEQGRAIFKEMKEIYGYQPTQEQYACMVDLLGRAGHLQEARYIIKSMPFDPDVQVWAPLLSASKMHRETKLAEFAGNKLVDLDPRNAGNYVLLSNIYAAAGKWDMVAKTRKFLKENRLKKTPGISCLDVNGRVHEFVAGGSHPKANDINAMLRTVELEIKRVKHSFNSSIFDKNLLCYT